MVHVQNGGVACNGSVQRLSCAALLQKPGKGVAKLECKALAPKPRKGFFASARAKLEPDAFRERRCRMEKALYSGVAACYMVYQG